MQLRVLASGIGLSDIADKLEAGERLSLDDGVRLFETPDLLRRRLAGQPRAREAARRPHLLQLQHPPRGDQRLRRELPVLLVRAAEARRSPAPTRCRSSRPGTSCGSARHQPLTEVHVVNGLHPDLPFDYYTELLRGFKRIRPDIHLKCFTAVEIAFFADLYGMTDEQVLRELMAAGLDSLPGGGAEIFAERVRRKIAHDKCGADRYLEIHRIAHRPRACARTSRCSTGTSRRRRSASITCCGRARCRTRPAGSRRSFRWRSIPTTTRCGSCRRRRAADTLRVHAVARLMLDNIPHIKAFWIATGVDVAQTALWFGVDDLDGTVQEEKIYHMAGSRTPEAMTPRQIERLIRRAGREPLERDTLYNVVARHAVERRPASLANRAVRRSRMQSGISRQPDGVAGFGFSSVLRLRKVSQARALEASTADSRS